MQYLLSAVLSPWWSAWAESQVQISCLWPASVSPQAAHSATAQNIDFNICCHGNACLWSGEKLVFFFVFFFLGWPACCDPADRPHDPASLLCFQHLPARQLHPTHCPCMLVSGHEASRSLFASNSSQEIYIKYYNISFMENDPLANCS